MIEFTVPMGNDDEGFFGRECPREECLGYFKIELGTGLKGQNLPCHCPYCGHVGPHDTFWTQDQLQYARTLAIREAQKHIGDLLQRSLPRSRPKPGELISLTFEYKPGRPLPIYRYQEQALETELVCSDCGLHYAVFGVFAYCPDCGSHNSGQILNANLSLAEKQLALASTTDPELASVLVSDALENCVSAFDAFGRELIAANADLAIPPSNPTSITCQNVDRLRTRLLECFRFDLALDMAADDWARLVIAFQKRHLLAHRAGVIDQAYIDATQDDSATVGRKIRVTSAEVTELIPLVGELGMRLNSALRSMRQANR